MGGLKEVPHKSICCRDHKAIFRSKSQDIYDEVVGGSQLESLQTSRRSFSLGLPHRGGNEGQFEAGSRS
jgi:hypothetical protein